MSKSSTFDQLNLRKELLKNLSDLNYKTMTPIQQAALPEILAHKDILAQAKTGSGKTATFGLAILNQINSKDLYAHSLIICPTRELSEQVAKEIKKLARLISNIRVLTLCGGVSQKHQVKSLSYGAHVIVGTPGRIFKLISEDKLKLDQIKSFILDEADKMLDMGFYVDMIKIKTSIKSPHQTMLFSATFPEEIKLLSKEVQHNAVDIKVDSVHKNSQIKQEFFEVQDDMKKGDSILKLLWAYTPKRCLIFCKTKMTTHNLYKKLHEKGFYAAALHGDLDQNQRTNVLTKFMNNSLTLLVSTDVAARGIDIQDLDLVINYDLPSDPEVYIHRIGRTGRAGLKGHALSLFYSKEENKLAEIEAITQSSLQKKDIHGLKQQKELTKEPPMQTLYISGGKKNKLRPGDILGALIGEAQLEAQDVGAIDILNIVSYVAIKKESFQKAMKGLQEGKIKNRKFKVGPA